MEEHGIEYYRGSHLTVSSIDQQPSARGHALLFRILSDYPESSGRPVYSTMQALGSCSDCYLENDGHFNEEGHRQLAAFLHRQVL